MADDKALADLARRVLGLVAKRWARGDRWTLTYPAGTKGAAPGSVRASGITTADLRGRVLAAAHGKVTRAALGPPDARGRLGVTRARCAREVAEAEERVRECEADEEEARALLDEVRKALGEGEAGQ